MKLMAATAVAGTAASGPVTKTTRASLVYVCTRTPCATPHTTRRSLPTTSATDLLAGTAGHPTEDMQISETEAESIWRFRMSLAAASLHTSCPRSEQVNGSPVDSEESQKNTRVVLNEQMNDTNHPLMSEV